MVSLRLSRFGTKNKPKYRVVAVDSRKKRDGAYIEEIGFYDPTLNPFYVKINKDRFNHWLSVGARPSKTVENLVKKHHIERRTT